MFTSQISASAATITDLDVQALRKDEAAWDDVDGAIAPLLKSNVLFLVESTATMAFSPKGVMPTVVLNREGGETDSHGHGTRDWTEREGESANWGATYRYYGVTQDDINNMMEYATYGMGALPAAYGGQNIDRSERNLYGRDIDESNNWKGSEGNLASDMEVYKNSYYFPFAKASGALKEAFEKQTTALQSHFNNAPLWRADHHNGDIVDNVINDRDGDPVNYGFTYKGNAAFSAVKPLPYALVFKNPAWWASGPPEGAAVTSYDLVPNDSRMYQAKLVLWRLLEEPNIFQSLRVGLATTYLNPANKKYNYNNNDHDDYTDAYDIHGIFRVPPFGSNLYARTVYTGVPGDKERMKDKTEYAVTPPYKVYGSTRYGDNAAPDDLSKGRYTNGIMTQAITGQVRAATRLHGQYVPVWAAQTNEPLYGMAAYTTGSDLEKSKIVYRLLNRGSLHVPIREYNAEWKTKNGAVITQADKIRMWINGLADIKNGDNAVKNNQFHFYKDPEIGISGVFSLPGAIFPDDSKDDRKRSYLAGNSPSGSASKYIVHSHKSNHTSHTWNVYANSTEYEDPEFEANSQFIAGSGEATGSVIDFFSPYSVDNNLADVSYPIRSACEDNWVIVIASGIELKKAEEAAYSYESWEAIKKLYDYTANNKVYMLARDKDGNPLGENGNAAPADSAGRKIESVKLENPIRTLVIGLVPTIESVEGEPEAIRDQVAEMHANLTKMARAGQGYDPNDASAPAAPFLADDVESLEIALREALQLIIDSQKQPVKGTILESPAMSDLGQDESFNLYSAMFRIRRDNQWEGYLTRFAVKEEDDGGMTLSEKWELSDKIKATRGSRDLRYWNGSAFTALGGGGDFKLMTGLDKDKMYKGNITGAAFTAYPPEKAMYEWLQGYDHSYGQNKNFNRFSMLAEMGQGGIAFIDDPAPSQSLPGYYEWANGITPGSPDIYLQTNDGVLHIVNPSTGVEETAIVPPPVLIPSRLATMKTRRTDGGLRWLDVNGPESTNKQDILASRSVSVYTLDGALQKRAFSDPDGRNWRLQLLAGLGRGGSGLYMLDISDRDNPKLMWYKERIGGNLLEMTASDKMPSVAASPGTEFMKLGFNSPRAAMGVTGSSSSMRNFIAMTGGMQNSVDLSKNGDEGAALLMLDPADGSLIKGFGAADVENWDHVGSKTAGPAPAMGMMVSEPTLLKTGGSDVYGSYLTGAVYAADNRGTIFRVALENKTADVVTSLSPENWNIRAVATLHPDPKNSNPAAASACYAIPFGVQLAARGDYVWLSGGTTDLRGRISETYPAGVLNNTSQMIFAFRTERYKNDFHRESELKALNAESDDALNPDDLNKAGKNGWKIPLRASSSGWGAEYVSARPLVSDGVLYIATFRENRSPAGSSKQLCETKGGTRIDGESRVYVLDIESGGPIWATEEDKKYIRLEHAKITGITLSAQGKKSYVFLTYDKMSGGDVPLDLSGFKGKSIHLEEANSIVFPKIGGGVKNLKEGQNVVQYWLKN
jgi:Tfp pilus tip-associated adhesin PilY1